MSNTAFTPGPWVWQGKSGSLHQVGEPPYAFGKVVLHPEYEYDSGVDTAISDADADLIAAAPDLYAALRRTELYFFGNSAWRNGAMSLQDEIRAALAKARGETL